MREDGTLTIDGRFNGPAGSANGGYACGVLAGLCAEPVAVTLHAPPRLDVPLQARVGPRRSHLWDGDEVVATAAPTRHRPATLAPVTVGAARSAVDRYRGRAGHPFPHCFACGPERDPGDGLLLAPGPVPDRPGTVACPWTPDDSVADEDGRVRPEFVWSALDCPSGWTTDLVSAPKVLGWMHARVAALPRAGRTYVAVARLDAVEGHGITAASALFDAHGRPVACATTRWFGG